MLYSRWAQALRTLYTPAGPRSPRRCAPNCAPHRSQAGLETIDRGYNIDIKSSQESLKITIVSGFSEYINT